MRMLESDTSNIEALGVSAKQRGRRAGVKMKLNELDAETVKAKAQQFCEANGLMFKVVSPYEVLVGFTVLDTRHIKTDEDLVERLNGCMEFWKRLQGVKWDGVKAAEQLRDVTSWSDSLSALIDDMERTLPKSTLDKIARLITKRAYMIQLSKVRQDQQED